MADVATSRPSNMPHGSHTAPHNESSRDLEEVAPEPEPMMLPRSVDNDQMEVQSNGFSNQSEVVDTVGDVDGDDVKDAASEVPQV